MAIEISTFRCMSDNFGVLVHDAARGTTISVDAPDGATVIAAAEKAGWPITHIIVTHRHPDHVQGIAAVKARFGCEVIAARQAGDEVPSVDRRVSGGETVDIGGVPMQVFDTPGHCIDHISYYAPDAKALFCGDVIFKLGCGRVMESPYETLFQSIEMLSALPDDTRVYGGHDYVLGNARFAAAVEPDNPQVQALLKQAEADQSAGRLTAITTLSEEKAANPFLRTREPSVAKAVKLEGALPADVFKALREWKNRF